MQNTLNGIDKRHVHGTSYTCGITGLAWDLHGTNRALRRMRSKRARIDTHGSVGGVGRLGSQACSDSTKNIPVDRDQRATKVAL